jgi:hemolysin activation/secretion protein
MKAKILIWAIAAICASASAQDERIAPKTPPAKPPADELGMTEAEKAAPDDPLFTLQAIIVYPSLTDVKGEGVPGAKGVQIHGPEFLRTPEFEAFLSVYLGQPMSLRKIYRLQREVILYCRKMDHPIIDVFYPEQDSTQGLIQMVVLEGKVGKIIVNNPEPQHFPDSRFTNNVTVKPGSYVLESQLLEDINWMNRNSYFRDVNVTFRQGELGQVDLQLDVKDRPPVRPYFGYENSGNEILGEHRALVGVNLGDVFGLDHQFNYQFTTDIDIQTFKAHSVSYVAPLPWRHILTFFGAYVDIDADLAEIGLPGFTQQGESYQASMRYGIPLPRIAALDHELSAGFDFKRTDNFLDFGFPGLAAFQTKSDIAQFMVGYRAFRLDPFGSTAAGIQAFYSPGGLAKYNKDDNFDQTSPGTDEKYVYVRALASRATKLPFGENWKQRDISQLFSWHIAGTYQWADSGLLPSEQLGIGGYATVRGYEERAANGNDGWIINNELRTPAFRLSNLLGKPGEADTLQFLVFSDYGAARTPQDDFDLFSVGGGMRFNISTHFQFRFDYGWQLTDKGISSRVIGRGKQSRAHMGALLSF